MRRCFTCPAAVAGLLVLLLATACGGDGSTGPGLILCGAVNESGMQEEGITVIRPDTGQVATIETGFLIPEWEAPLQGTALYQDLRSGEWFLVDAFEATATRLDIDADVLLNALPPASVSARVDDLVVLTSLDGSGPGVLVNMASGEVTDLAAVMSDAPAQIFIVDFDSSGDRVLLGDGLDSLWIVPTAAPEQTRMISGAWTGDLSNDGERIVYVADGQVFVEDTGAGPTTSIAEGARAARFVDDGVLVLYRDSVAFLDGGSLETLWEGSALQPFAYVDAAGSNALVEIVDENLDHVAYLHLDPGGRRVTELDTGTVWQPASWPIEYLLLVQRESLPDTTLPVIVKAVAVNLSEADAANLYVPAQGLSVDPVRWSRDGRFALFVGSDRVSLWLIDLEAGTSTEIEGEARSFTFSPGGTRFAVVEAGGDNDTQAELVIYDISDPSEPERLGVSCVNPIWVAQG